MHIMCMYTARAGKTDEIYRGGKKLRRMRESERERERKQQA